MDVYQDQLVTIMLNPNLNFSWLHYDVICPPKRRVAKDVFPALMPGNKTVNTPQVISNDGP
ncbi:hypothetical protein [Staphylococcus phage vB_SauH_DELF3]|nr:hypothetical protein [Staphylococcus phage vB_SauH_DELF3]